MLYYIFFLDLWNVYLCKDILIHMDFFFFVGLIMELFIIPISHKSPKHKTVWFVFLPWSLKPSPYLTYFFDPLARRFFFFFLVSLCSPVKRFQFSGLPCAVHNCCFWPTSLNQHLSYHQCRWWGYIWFNSTRWSVRNFYRLCLLCAVLNW
jgi:hypothetical protein